MDKTKRVSSPPDPAAPLGRGRSRIQSLRDGVASALRSTRRASDEELEVPSISRASLLAELNRIRRATQQHGRLLETLERASHELRRQGSVERGVGAQQRELVLTDQDRGLAALLDEYEAKLDQVRAERDAATQLVRQQKTMVDDQDEFLAGLLDEHEAKLSEAYAQRDEAQELVEEQKAMLNDHDRFLAELLDEHEEDMAKAVAERDQLQQRIRQLQRELSATRPVAPQGAAGAPAQGAHAPEANAELHALRKELGQARKRVDQLASKYTTARETLHRVLDQRDEAQQAVVQLSRELWELKERSATPAPQSWLPGGRAEAPPRSKTPPYPPLARPVHNAVPEAARVQADPGRPGAGADALPRRSAQKSAQPLRSPLATVLANTDPTKK
jgi:chromosome segregation ATPase